MAFKISNALEELNYDFLGKPSSNQIFPILPNKIIDELLKNYSFYKWSKIDNEHSAVRLVTSWATEEKVVYKFIEEIRKLGDNNE